MSDIQTGWDAARRHMKEAADALTEKDDPYAAFARIRSQARKIASPPVVAPTDDFQGVTVITEDGYNRHYRRVGLTVYVSESYDLKKAQSVRTVIDENADDKNLKIPTTIQYVTEPERQADGMWKIDMTIVTELSYDQAKTLYRGICEKLGQKTDGGLYADEGSAVIDWVARYQIRARLEEALLKSGLDDVAIDIERIGTAEQKLEVFGGPISRTGSSMNFVV